MTNVEVKRTLDFWKSFFANEQGLEGRKNGMLLKALMFEKKYKGSRKMTYQEVVEAITLLGNRCIHDTDKALHNTRRNL